MNHWEYISGHFMFDVHLIYLITQREARGTKNQKNGTDWGPEKFGGIIQMTTASRN